MMTKIEIEQKLIDINFDKPILDYFKGYFDDCFIILHPFYKKVFADNYNEFTNYKLTYPLLQKVTWEEILERTGIKSKAKLALTITYPACDIHFRSLVESERKEFTPFLYENNIIEPFWEEDKIPEDIILPFIEFILKQGYTDIKVGHWPEHSNELIQTITINDENKFDCAVKFARQNFIFTSDKKFCLKLPYRDLPYTFLLTDKVSAYKVATELNYEGFRADHTTKTYWPIEK
jgi:hypothetical protein